MGLVMGWECASACPASLCAGPMGKMMFLLAPARGLSQCCPTKAQGQGAGLGVLENGGWERGACGAALG